MDRPGFPQRVIAPEHLGLVQQLLPNCTFPPTGTEVNLAVSGGADSMSLLVLAVAAGCRVHAYHVDHGLREGSQLEAEVVARAAERFGAQFSALSVDVPPGPNLEARARVARYAVLPNDVLTGHTADDQAETMLLNLIRGAGVDGLAGIAPERRPILGLRRYQTEQLCETLGIEVVIDPTNATGLFRRNRIRHEILPLLNDIAERDVVPIMARQSALLREVSEFLAGMANEIDPTDAKALSAAPKALARVAIRQWVMVTTGLGHPPSQAAVERILSVAQGEAKGTELTGGWRVVRRSQRLHLVEPQG